MAAGFNLCAAEYHTQGEVEVVAGGSAHFGKGGSEACMCSPAQRGIRWCRDEDGGVQPGPLGGLGGGSRHPGAGGGYKPVGMRALAALQAPQSRCMLGWERAAGGAGKMTTVSRTLTSVAEMQRLRPWLGRLSWRALGMAVPNSESRIPSKSELDAWRTLRPRDRSSPVTTSAHVQCGDALKCVKALKSIAARRRCRLHYSAERLRQGVHHRDVAENARTLSGDVAHVRTCLRPVDVIGRM